MTNKMNTGKLRVSLAFQRVIEGKLHDRATGVSGSDDDIYGRIAAQAQWFYGDVTLDVNIDEASELLEEAHWALDGYRDLPQGERKAAVAMRKNAALLVRKLGKGIS